MSCHVLAYYVPDCIYFISDARYRSLCVCVCLFVCLERDSVNAVSIFCRGPAPGGCLLKLLFPGL